MTVAAPEATEREQTTLALEGMTCAACASRIERALNKLDGVEATVNFATETAAVSFDPQRVAQEQLIGAVEKTGYAAHPASYGEHDHRHDAKPTRLGLAVALSTPLVVLAMVSHLQFAHWEWLAFALATPVVFWSGAEFHRAALVNARHGAATMDTLVSLGTLAAWTWSTVALVAALDADTYFEVAAVITTLILLGRFFEARAKRRSGAAIRAILELAAEDAAHLQVGDEFDVKPGQKIATDGIVVAGASAVDQSLLTGESVPIEVGVGSVVVGATINTYGSLRVRATRVGSDTALAHIARLVEQAQAGKASVQRLADRVSAVFVPIVIAIALATLAGWLISGATASDAFTAAGAGLIIPRPCAPGPPTPTAPPLGTGPGAPPRNGVQGAGGR